jgi:hypothetical protein
MRLPMIGHGIGAIVPPASALVHWRTQCDAENRVTAKFHLVPGLIVLGIAAIFAAMWPFRHAARCMRAQANAEGETEATASTSCGFAEANPEMQNRREIQSC